MNTYKIVPLKRQYFSYLFNFSSDHQTYIEENNNNQQALSNNTQHNQQSNNESPPNQRGQEIDDITLSTAVSLLDTDCILS